MLVHCIDTQHNYWSYGPLLVMRVCVRTSAGSRKALHIVEILSGGLSPTAPEKLLCLTQAMN